MNMLALSTLSLCFVLAPGGAGAAPLPSATRSFFAAIEAGNQSTVEAMLRRDPALAAARGPSGATALEAAAFLRDGEGFVCNRKNPVLRLIASRSRARELDVFEAAVIGDVRRLAALLEKDRGLVAARHAWGATPLHFAAFAGKVEAARLLLDSGAVIDARARNEFRNTPLQMGLLCGDREVLAYLLSRGADPNVRQNEGFHPLHEAALLGRVELIQLLLDSGADVSPRSDGGETPLGTAVRKGKTRAAAFLRERGAVK